MTDQEKLSILGFMELAIGRGVPFIVAWQGKENIELCTTMNPAGLAHSVGLLKEKLANGEVDYSTPIPEFPS